MTLEDWDKKISPRLQIIEASAASVKRHAEALICRPDFETLAEDQLCKAHTALLNALTVIEDARAVYAGKPLESA